METGRPSSSRERIGATLLVLSAILIPVQIVVAAAWPSGYSLTDHAISDLGVTTCGEFSEQGHRLRTVCSPLHPLFNAGMVLSGALILAGALLTVDHWRSRLGGVGMAFLGLSGLGVVGAGLAPWDVSPDVHDLAALVQAAAQWVAMICVAVVAGRCALRWLTIAALGLSLLGFVGFILAVDGLDIPLVGFGGAERLSFDTLTVWVAVLGVVILERTRRASRAQRIASLG
ncbi:putative membrane protein [Brevibacterium sanguinis]|uniref:Membrane protein n=2 Tax=Brevibacterium TaxID=1696 RepID=A0ABX9GRV3_9MICO|nr:MULTISPECIES: DUF998 domain-containing protein [Brevibacterium]RBP64774.1 putative membrane protein [Brevibacterium sanguinis]RBP71583.1 putative membrane protein [Brevibacterium celere]